VGEKEAISCLHYWFDCRIYLIFDGMLDGVWKEKSGRGYRITIEGDIWSFSDGDDTRQGRLSHWEGGSAITSTLKFEQWLKSYYELNEISVAKKILKTYETDNE
jgi:hypothetical protein